MNDNSSSPSVDLLRRIDAVCDRFEESWRGGLVPKIEDYLAFFRADERSSLLDALQSLQQELTLRNPINSETVPKTHDLVAVEGSDDSPSPQTMEFSEESQNEKINDDKSARVTFRVIAGPHEGLGFTFHEHNTLFAGRLPRAQLRLEKDLHFSRHHFRLEVNPPTCFLMDLNSRNGTFVNGERVKDRFLLDGDIVSGGRTKMVVSIFVPNDVKLKPTTKSAKPSEPPQGPPPVPPKHPPSIPPKPVATPKIPQQQRGDSPVSIPGYEIHEQIGAGDLGIVYRARKLSSNEMCALKILSPAGHTDEASIQAFLRQASVLNQLQHSHIIRLLELGAAGQNIFLATEYVSSYSWDDFVSRYAPEKRVRIACGVMSQILSALGYAHDRSFVHRDVKPGNILITKKDDKLVAKLADFGIAKQYTTAGMSQVTRDGDVLGSLPFMSPDQFLNSRDARPTCDLYSAGATLYWMLTGHEPIRLEGHPCKFLAILEAPPTPIQQYNPVIPDALALIVHRSLEKTPEKRFSSAAEMRHQIKTFLK